MKKDMLMNSITFMLLFLTAIGCEKGGGQDNIYWEISPESNNYIIQEQKNGIEFKFCLLNEKEESVTVFNEEENFSFYFAVTNSREDTLYFYPGFAFSNDNDFCRIYNSDNQDLGKPYFFRGVELVGISGFILEPGETYAFKQPWVDNHDSNWNWHRGNFISAKQEFIPKGNYYTGFGYRFEFIFPSNESFLSSDILSFKINFKIQ